MRLFNSRGPRSQSKSMLKCFLLLYLARLISEYMLFFLFYFAEKFC